MAIRIPSNLYSEGNVGLNSNAFTQFYLQSQNKKRAKDEALDSYFQNVGKSINPAGMRTQDIEGGWMQKVNDWRGFYQQNKDFIKNPKLDNGRSYNEYFGRFQDIINDTEKSKNLVVNTAKIAPVLTDPNKRTRLPETVLGSIHKQDLSIYDPEHKPFDLAELDYDAKPFGIPEQQKLNKYLTQGLKMGSEIQKVSVDPRTHGKIITTQFEYDPKDLMTVGQRAAYAYKQDPQFQNFIDQESENPQKFNEINNSFKNVFGKDIVSHEDFAAAYALNTIQRERQEQKVTGYNPFLGMSSSGANNPANKFNYGVEMTNALRTNDANKISNLVNLLRSGKGNTVLHDAFPRKEGGVDYIYLQLKDKDQYGEGDTYTKRYAVNDAGLPNILTNLYQQIMGADAVQEKLQYPTDANNVVAPTQQTAQPPKQQPKTQAPAKKTIKKSDISAKAAAAGYSVEEYQKLLKQNGVQIVD